MAARLFIAFTLFCMPGTPVLACDNGPFPIRFIGRSETLTSDAAEMLRNTRGWLEAYGTYPSLARKVRVKVTLFKRTASGHVLSASVQGRRWRVIRQELVAHGVPSDRILVASSAIGRRNRVGNAPASIEVVQSCT